VTNSCIVCVLSWPVTVSILCVQTHRKRNVSWVNFLVGSAGYRDM